MKLILAMMGLLGTSAVTGATYQYKISDYPASQPTVSLCESQAESLASAIRRHEDVANVTGVCEALHIDSFDIVVHYESDHALPIVSTYYADHSLAGPGFFSSKAACDAILYEEEQAFVAAVGIAPLFRPYCFAVDRQSPRSLWMFRIDAIGEALAKPRVESTPFFGTIIDYSEASFLSDAKTGLSRLGIEARYGKIQPLLGMAYAGFYMYTSKNHSLDTAEFAKLPTEELCRTELSYLKEASIESSVVVSYCSVQVPTDRVEVSAMFLDGVSFESLNSIEPFDDYAACASQREAVVNHHRAQGLVVSTGLCSLNTNDQWELVLLVPNR